MANCSIPSSSPANGRILTRSSGRSKKRSNRVAGFDALRLTQVADASLLRCFNTQRQTVNARCSMEVPGSWLLDAGRRTFSSCRRVKGAWWPSRSSKPSSPRKWRGRFDSYPLRRFVSNFRLPVAGCRFRRTGGTISIANRNSKIETG